LSIVEGRFERCHSSHDLDDGPTADEHLKVGFEGDHLVRMNTLGLKRDPQTPNPSDGRATLECRKTNGRSR
jgi:hypothetical protein